MRGFIFLGIAIVFEVFGTTMLKVSEGFTLLYPSLGVAIGFIISFTFLGLSFKTVALSTAYAIWAGIGTALTALIGMIAFDEGIGIIKVIALICIIVGIVILNKSKDYSGEEQV